MFKKGDEITVDIIDLNSEGKGISKLEDGLVIFSKDTLPGDRALVKITKNKSNYGEAKLEKILEASPHRIEAPCRYFGICGGCKIQNLDYDGQIIFKTKIVKDAFERIGGFKNLNIPGALKSDEIFFYRNKMEFSFSDDMWLDNPIRNGEEIRRDETVLKFDKQWLKDRGLILGGYHLPYNPKLVERAREYRKNLTEAERKLWYQFLSNHKERFLRQRPIDNYIADFYCAKAKLIIELDGGHHLEVNSKLYDEERATILEEVYGLKVMRFANKDVVDNFENVCDSIDSVIQERKRAIPPGPPLQGGKNNEREIASEPSLQGGKSDEELTREISPGPPLQGGKNNEREIASGPPLQGGKNNEREIASGPPLQGGKNNEREIASGPPLQGGKNNEREIASGPPLQGGKNNEREIASGPPLQGGKNNEREISPEPSLQGGKNNEREIASDPPLQGGKNNEREIASGPPLQGGKSDEELLREIPPDPDLQGRNKKFALGLHVPKFHSKIIDIYECLLQSKISNEILNFTRQFFKDRSISVYSTREQSGFLRFLIIRQSKNYNDLMINLITYDYNKGLMEEYSGEMKKNFPQITSIINTVSKSKAQVATGEQEYVLYGKEFLTEILRTQDAFKYTFNVSPQSFFQTNTLQSERLFNTLVSFSQFKKSDNVLDLYCGIGSISIFISSLVNKVLGVELNSDSVLSANENAKMNNVRNVNFMNSDIKDFLENSDLSEYNKLILDPPRSGLHPKICELLSEKKFERIMYVSCNPHTQARDLKIICSRGHYEITAMQPVDMFPHTYHVENITVLKGIE